MLLAHGRDPYFPGWPDTLQLNYANLATQEAMIGELEKMSGQCDGLRCDMAMLVLPDVFERAWGSNAHRGFWPRATQRVRERVPDFLFMAEVYWDLEWTLQHQGFDYAYDKRLYDRLREQHARPVREHFHAGLDYQDKLARFLENHDEPRAAATFSPEVHKAAAVMTFLSPGLRYFHEGQFQGRKKRITPHLCRRPDEPLDADLARILRPPARRAPSTAGARRPLAIARLQPPPGGATGHRIAFWDSPGNGSNAEHLFAVVNYAPNQSQCYVRLPFTDLGNRQWRLQDQMNPITYDRDGNDLQSRGLYLDMLPWQAAVFSMTIRD